MTEGNEFPFVAQLPKREKAKWQRIQDQFEEAKEKAGGMCVPSSFAAKFLGISRARICVLMDEGRMEFVKIGNVRYVTERGMIAWAKAEHRNGRPSKERVFQAAIAGARELMGLEKRGKK